MREDGDRPVLRGSTRECTAKDCEMRGGIMRDDQDKGAMISSRIDQSYVFGRIGVSVFCMVAQGAPMVFKLYDQRVHSSSFFFYMLMLPRPILFFIGKATAL